MATLEKIRNRAGVLVAVVIGMALLAFILGDFLNSGGALFSNTQFEIAEIAGTSIPYQTYQRELNSVVEFNKFISGQTTFDETATQRFQSQTWMQLVRENVMEDEYDEVGLSISGEELYDMVQGENIHPIILNLFTNQETGEFNRLQVLRFLKTYDQDPTGQQKAFWLFVENQMIQERMFTKYSTLISKGLYSTSLEAQNELVNTSKKVDFEFVAQNINTIPDSIISIKQSDLKHYYDNHKNEYKQEASRNIEYITFDVVASEEDKIETEEWINNIKEDFAITDNDKEFANINSYINFNNSYLKKDELPEELKDIMFDAKVGYMHGPYFQDDAFLLAKLSEINLVSDSVKAKHILLQPTQNQDAGQIYATADSILNLLENGESFARLSKEFSADKVANEKEGDLGWFRANQWPSQFSDTCFAAKKGEYKLTATQYGLHIVQVTDKARKEKKVRVSILARKLEPSSETYQKTYAEASKFAGNNHTYGEFIKAIDEEGLTKKIASDIKEADQQLAGLENPRGFIRSIYETEKHDLIKSQNNPIFELGDRYVIAFVSEVKEEGFATMEQVNSQLVVQVKKEKKAEYIANKFNEAIQENNDLEFIASKFNTEVLEATDINFRSYSVPNAGVEPKLVAVATSIDADYITAPIKGDNNVFVIRVNNISSDENANVDLQQRQTMMQYQNRANYEAFEALKETANIVDKRAKFY